MRILLTADPFIPVPPTQYGGIERVIHMLIDGYVDAGHEVHLLAHPDSHHEKLSSLHAWPESDTQRGRQTLRSALRLRAVTHQIQPDIVHSFSRLQTLMGIRWSRHRPRILQCYQREISPRTTGTFAKLFPASRLQFSACGAHMLNPAWPHRNRWHAVHNCTDTNQLQWRENATSGHFVFLGRIEPIKGIEEAIALAKQTRTPLHIAGNVEPAFEAFFQDRVKPHIDGETIRYLGPVNDEGKRKLFNGAKAFLMLIQWEEPFGIVMAEALACGVPILALNRGSVPEIVIDGKNGFRADTLTELIEKSKGLDAVEPTDCRKDAEDRFSVRVISQAYLHLFNTAFTP